MTDTRYDFYKSLEIDVKVDFDFNVDVDVKKDTDITMDVDTKFDLDGNSAELILSVEAIGEYTHVEADVAILTVEGELSSIDLYAISVVD